MRVETCLQYKSDLTLGQGVYNHFASSPGVHGPLPGQHVQLHAGPDPLVEAPLGVTRAKAHQPDGSGLVGGPASLAVPGAGGTGAVREDARHCFIVCCIDEQCQTSVRAS